MKTIETIALVTGDGKLTIDAPKGITPGRHRVKVDIDEKMADEKPKPAYYFKGRPVYTQEQLAKMPRTLPDESAWAAELERLADRRKKRKRG